ncbi:HAMP domain-containing protein [Rhodobacteraceae bacterium]|nr:HAMP domain-containing protein [Paracoccaceae bacterium]
MTVLSIQSTTLRVKAAKATEVAALVPLISDRFADVLREADDGAARAALSNLATEAEGTNIGSVLLTRNGKLLAERDDRGTAEQLRTMAKRALRANMAVKSEDGLFYAYPIPNPGKARPLGVFASAWSADRAIAQAYTDLFHAMGITGGIFLILMLAMSWATHAYIGRPLGRLQAAVKRVADEEYDTNVEGTKRRDEVGQIARALDEFRSTLQQSARDRADALLRASALKFSASAVVLTNDAHKIIYANAAAEALFSTLQHAIKVYYPEFRADQLRGLDASRIVPPNAKDQAVDKTRRVIEAQLSQAWLRVIFSPVVDSSGQKIGYVSEWLDIGHARRNAAIMDAIDASQIHIDVTADGRIGFASPTLLQILTKYSCVIAELNLATDLMLGASPLGELVAQAAPQSGLFTLTLKNRTLSLEGTLNPIVDEDGNLVQMVFLATDRTDALDARALADAQKREMENAQKQVVDSLRGALATLSEGNLRSPISTAFNAEYDPLRRDFNRALERLNDALLRVKANANMVHSEAHQIANAATDLSGRTEKQATTLAETASAMSVLTMAVQSATQGADRANQMVTGTKEKVTTSGVVVREAIEAMEEIKESSDKISKITSVIDDIAFQTNLLALNAGVEAARAGDAGRGFAVVASEVRALAQRSSDAAREIAKLISSSSDQVKRGVGLVGQAGEALDGIQKSVAEITVVVSEITSSSHEQSSGISEINIAVKELDQVTQQNAAMFEQTSATSQSLSGEAQSLMDVLSLFQLAEDHAASPVKASSPQTPRSSVPPRAQTPQSAKPAPKAKSLPVQKAKPPAPRAGETSPAPVPQSKPKAVPPKDIPKPVAHPPSRPKTPEPAPRTQGALALKPSNSADQWQDDDDWEDF